MHERRRDALTPEPIAHIKAVPIDDQIRHTGRDLDLEITHVGPAHCDEHGLGKDIAHKVGTGRADLDHHEPLGAHPIVLRGQGAHLHMCVSMRMRAREDGGWRRAEGQRAEAAHK